MKQAVQNIPIIREYNEIMRNLSEKWELLSLLGEMSNSGMNIVQNRESFEHLSQKMINKLVEEISNRTLDEMKNKAQVAIDVLIRNLFERTADIGFLSTDENISEYLHATMETKTSLLPRLQLRLREYIEKYSVYDDILIFSPKGRLIVSAKGEKIGEKINLSFIDEVLKTNKGYVETFGSFQIFGGKPSLLYSYKINDKHNKPIAVLSLVFKFKDEMELITKGLIGQNDSVDILLLNENNQILFTSDPYHYPEGCAMRLYNDAQKTIIFAGREYLMSSRTTKGYQGFNGQPWKVLAITPLSTAFIQDQINSKIEGEYAEIIKHSTIFPQELSVIPEEAGVIQKKLNLTIWNGNASISNKDHTQRAFPKSLLNEIAKTGLKTKEVFEGSIANLTQTVIASFQENCQAKCRSRQFFM